MLLACSWSVLSFGPLARWPFASAQGRIRCPTLAPRAPPRDRVQKGKGLQLSQAAAQAITVVILWLTQHFGANPPTSRKCYRSTATIRMILSMLLVSFFPPVQVTADFHRAQCRFGQGRPPILSDLRVPQRGRARNVSAVPPTQKEPSRIQSPAATPNNP